MVCGGWLFRGLSWATRQAHRANVAGRLSGCNSRLGVARRRHASSSRGHERPKLDIGGQGFSRCRVIPAWRRENLHRAWLVESRVEFAVARPGERDKGLQRDRKCRVDVSRRAPGPLRPRESLGDRPLFLYFRFRRCCAIKDEAHAHSHRDAAGLRICDPKALMRQLKSWGTPDTR